MNLILNDKEIVLYIVSLLDYQPVIQNIELNDLELSEVIGWWCEKKRLDGKKFNEQKHKGKLKEKIKRAVSKDLKTYLDSCENQILYFRKEMYNKIFPNLDYFLEKLNVTHVLEKYKKSKFNNFVKSTGQTITKKSIFIRRKSYINFESDCLIRNTTGNENCLLTKIKNNYPFWFIDSGYTNFIEPNKKWHRLVRNHLHHKILIDYPADRLQNFKEFPKPWREKGSIILVIEPGEFSAKIFNINITQWKIDVEKKLKEHSDKIIRFRPKISKKQRAPLYKELLNDDYYCVININSNAATEAIWAGIPIITLDRHITNSVSKSKLEEINSLYRGPLGNWLCMLSYNQFTYNELTNGFAIETYKKYHE